jgi:hypothetical protein
MYLGELNGFLLFSAGNASLEWTGPEETELDDVQSLFSRAMLN